MIKYTFDKTSDTYTKIQFVWFDCNISISYQDMIDNPKLIRQLDQLEETYSLQYSLYNWLYYGLLWIETKDGTKLQSTWEYINTLTEEFVSSKTTETIDFSKLNESEKEKSFSYQELRTDISSLEFELDQRLHFDALKSNHIESSAYLSHISKQRYFRTYLTFLYLVKKETLFRCINPATMNVDIIDSGNLHHHIQGVAHIILPVDEYLHRWDVNTDQYRTISEYNKMSRTSALNSATNHDIDIDTKEAISRCKTPLWKDVSELQKEYPYTWAESMLSICRERLADNRTSKIELDSKKNYWLVKPTIKSDNIDDRIIHNTNSFWKLEIKKHSLWTYNLKHTEYTPTYIVFKWKQE